MLLIDDDDDDDVFSSAVFLELKCDLSDDGDCQTKALM